MRCYAVPVLSLLAGLVLAGCVQRDGAASERDRPEGFYGGVTGGHSGPGGGNGGSSGM